MRIHFAIIWVFALLFTGCGTSYQYSVVKDRQLDYQRSSKAYHDAEEDYITLLFNLERVPGDPYLLQQKKIKMQELVYLRSVMLQSRGEFDESVQQWELAIRTERGVQKGGAPEPEYFYEAPQPPETLESGPTSPGRPNVAPVDSLVGKPKIAPKVEPTPQPVPPSSLNSGQIP
jgi:hypothetical protein